MAETYWQKLAHKVTPPEISREKFANVARILEEELSGIVAAAKRMLYECSADSIAADDAERDLRILLNQKGLM